MFKDYYAILEISRNATSTDIKFAFKKLAKRWHPDLNPNFDSTEKMQDLNEAKLILLDKEARIRYDKEYDHFYNYINTELNNSNRSNKKSYNEKDDNYEEYYNYEVKDDILKKWMQNAKKQANVIVSQSLRDVKGVTVAASKGCYTGILNAIIFVIIMLIIGFIISLF